MHAPTLTEYGVCALGMYLRVRIFFLDIYMSSVRVHMRIKSLQDAGEPAPWTGVAWVWQVPHR